METTRNNATGAITVKGKDFVIIITENGTVTCSGKATIIEPPPPPPGPKHADEPSPRSQPAIRKRGAR